jgi:L-fuconolactonase
MQNRREFIGAVSSLALATGCASVPNASEGILDTHTHFYDPTRPQGVPWPPKDDAFLYRTVMPEELKAMVTPLGVTGTIVVEASSWIEDNQWILELARNDHFIKGLVGHLKPGRAGFTRDLERFSANPLFRGIRVGLWDIPLAANDSSFVTDLRALAQRGLALDVLGGPDQIEKITSLAAAIPDLRIVVDHCAGARVTGGAPETKWVDGIKLLATRRNIHMKVSGLVEGTGRSGNAPANVEFYRPVLDVLWNSFGEDRVLYGSNWPVSARFASYASVLGIVREYVKGGTAAEKYFRRNAERVYLA